MQERAQLSANSLALWSAEMALPTPFLGIFYSFFVIFDLETTDSGFVFTFDAFGMVGIADFVQASTISSYA